MWTDECMNQLIAGIELAAAEGWDGIQEALTDTARVVQSYEESGQANLCVPFLQDSYEILCLMVGDIIVDNVRSGVIQKWRGRYAQAIEELHRAGLSLIRDEEPGEAGAYQETYSETEYATEAPVLESPWGDEAPVDRGLTAEEEEELAEEEAVVTPVETDFAFMEAEQEAVEESLFEPPTDASAPPRVPGNVLPFGLPPEIQETVPGIEADPEPILEARPASRPLLQQEMSPRSPAPVSPPSEPDTAHSTLLRTTQEAMSSGNVADAKVYALQLAVNMAWLEVEREEERLHELMAGRKEFEKAIESARVEVERTQRGVEDAEHSLADSEAEFQIQRKHSESLRDRVADIAAGVEKIEAQIRELQARREEESRRLAEAHMELDEVVALESRCQTELDDLADTEQSARETLERARRHLSSLEQDHAEREAEIALSKEELSRRRKSAADIEHTITLITGTHKTPELAAVPEAPQAPPVPPVPQSSPSSQVPETGMLF